ncbi:TPA: helix-turn-helix domain-containing protein [Vibrio harveyi]
MNDRDWHSTNVSHLLKVIINTTSELGLDWSPALIKCALEMSGSNVAQLATTNGIAPSTLRGVFRVRCPKNEEIVATALNMKPEQIWPSRYERKPTLCGTQQKSL